MKTISLTTIALSLCTLISFSNPAQAAIKCWTNKEGVRECGSAVPPEYAQKGYTELSKQGMVIERQEGAKTEEELAEQARLEAIEDEKQKIAERKARYDKILLDTFSNVDDIIMARDGKIAAIQSRINLAKKRNEKIQLDLDKRIKSAAAAERSGKAADKQLLKDIESLRRQIKNNETFIEERLKEQETVSLAYQKDIERYKLLKTGAVN